MHKSDIYKVVVACVLLNICLILYFKLFNNNYNKETIDNHQTSNQSNIDQKNDSKRQWPSVFCMIMASKGTLETRVKAVYETWAKDCDKYFFITKLESGILNHSIEMNDPFPILQPSRIESDAYKDLTRKVFATFRDVYEHYNNYDWYLKADDDTFIFMDNLKQFLSKTEPSEPITFGYNFKPYVEKGYHSGGAGYVLSKEALKRVFPILNYNQTQCETTGMEDIDVANCLRKVKVYPGESIDNEGRERFHPLDPGSHLTGYYPQWIYVYATNPVKKGKESVSETSISFHYIVPDQMKLLYKLWKVFKKHSKDKNPLKLTSLLLQMVI